MKVFKNFLAGIFAVGGLLYLGFSFYTYSLDPCEKPIEYSIGRFDTEFGVSKEEFKLRIAKAEEVWEKALDRNIFIYNPDAKFKINLIYDERQLATMQKQRTESGLAAAENILETLDTQFQEMKTAYETKLSRYEISTASFKEKQKVYTLAVEYWNNRGGAPKKEYEFLQKQAVLLNTEAERLNREASSLNTEAGELNLLLEKRNQAAREYNKTAENYNRKFSQGLEFNQAEYTGEEINVYQFSNKKDLDLALTHEFGHALGMGHVDSAGSIMYYITLGNDEINLVPSKDDLDELGRVCEVK